MKVVAKQEAGEVFLVILDEGAQQAFVADFDAGKRFPPFYAPSIIARGGWVECEHSEELLASCLELPEVVYAPPAQDDGDEVLT